MKNFRKTKIIGTIGPASDNEETLRELMLAGLNCARINFSHGGYEENEAKINLIKRLREELGLPIALALDTKGPEIRTGKFIGGEKQQLHEGDVFTFVKEEIEGDNTKTTISFGDLYKNVQPGNTILVDDGKIEFEVTAVEGTNIVTKVINGGELGQRKTVNVPGVEIDLPALSEKDTKDITDGIKAGFDYIFASFVRRPDDVLQIRKLLDDNGGENVEIISKIESMEGISNFDEILKLSNGIMVARGDLGVEIPLEQVPVVQKKMIRKCNDAGKPVIIATQMLESMQENPRPTRAEVSDVANAVYDLTSCIMLSGEVAQGKYPVECVKDMDKIAMSCESSLHYWSRFSAKDYRHSKSNFKAVSAYGSCIIAKEIAADGILSYTHTGVSLNYISSLRPGCPIVAVTDDKKTFYKLGLVQNVYPVFIEPQASINDTIEKGIKMLEKEGIFETGDVITICSGSKILPTEKESYTVGGVIKI